jgi:hypothetical protein
MRGKSYDVPQTPGSMREYPRPPGVETSRRRHSVARAGAADHEPSTGPRTLLRFEREFAYRPSNCAA